MIPDIDAERTSDEPNRGPFRAIATPRTLAALGFAIVGICLVLESWSMGRESPKTAIHILFGLLLCGLVVVRFNGWTHHHPVNLAPEIRQFSRELSRMVYLILYLVIGLQQAIRVIGYLQDDHHIARGVDLLRPPLDGQAFLVSGLVALVLIRVLAFWSWRRLR